MYLKENIPHLLVSGDNVLLNIRKMYKNIYKEDYSKCVITIDGMDPDVKALIQTHAKLKSQINSFKIIILLNADLIPFNIQMVLRLIMETNTNVTRFCLVCEYPNKIIRPLHSRCIATHFRNPIRKNLVKELQMFLDQETPGIPDKLASELPTDIQEGLVSIFVAKDNISLSNIDFINDSLLVNLIKIHKLNKKLKMINK